jgi:hypothetical protein
MKPFHYPELVARIGPLLKPVSRVANRDQLPGGRPGGEHAVEDVAGGRWLRWSDARLAGAPRQPALAASRRYCPVGAVVREVLVAT